jgi:hypothetical protein
MANNDRAPAEVWMVQTRGVNGSNIWIVGGESEALARDMVERNIGSPIIAAWPVANTGHIAIGELRLTNDRAPSAPATGD